MQLSVLIPTFRRPEHLARCLHGLEEQTKSPRQVIVVARESDTKTLALLEHEPFRLPLQVVMVDVPGQVAALNAGLDRVEGEIVAVTDDDARPRPEWLERIARHFASDATLGGVGGRDYLHDGHRYRDHAVVGKIQWFGRHIGNHHRGVGPPRYVDILKGANMSYRMRAVGDIRFDRRLLGAGAQLHNDMGFSLRIKQTGWRLLYDPEVAVDHFSAERDDDDRRLHRSPEAVRNDAHNETVVILEYLPRRCLPVFFAWAILIGHTSLPGCAQCLRRATFGRSAWSMLKPVVVGRCMGLRTLMATRRRAGAQEGGGRIGRPLIGRIGNLLAWTEPPTSTR
jgi:glycosyltransferase involved in cell wall biosynthesis